MTLIFYFHFSDILLVPFKEVYCGISHFEPICSVSPATLVLMKSTGALATIWWFAQTCFIFYLTDNSRISKGRYFIRYSYEVEIILLAIISVNRLGLNVLNFRLVGLRIVVNFGLYLGLLLTAKRGDGIVHPLTKKYFTLFCLAPTWFVFFQTVAVLTSTVLASSFLVALVSFGLFFPVFLFKIDEIDLELVASRRPESIDNPKLLLAKLDTLLIILREEQMGDEKYSILLEGIVREYQEYPNGDEVEMLNSFTRSEVKEKDSFFQKRYQGLLRLISLYYMKGISRHTDFPELRFSFVYFMFDFLELKYQAIQFLAEMSGHEMIGENFLKWISVKNEIESELLTEEEDRKDPTRLNITNQKIKYDQLAEELEKCIVKIMELWKLVTEENTKVRNIRDQLIQVTNSLKHLADFWKREAKYLERIPKCQILYGLFLRDSVFDISKGEDLVKKAMDELEKRKESALNFSEIDEVSSLFDMEKAVAFVNITKKSSHSFIENCSINFAKYLGTTKKNLLGTLLAEYMPQELLQSFLDGAITSQTKPRDLSIQKTNQCSQEADVKLPFLTFHGRLVKEFFVQTKVLLNQGSEQVLALHLSPDHESGACKWLMNLSGQVRFVNSSKLQSPSDAGQIFLCGRPDS